MTDSQEQTEIDAANQLPRLTLKGEPRGLDDLLGQLRDLIHYNPRLVRQLVTTLVAEGRKFAGTPEGMAWQVRLADSTLVKQGRLIWQAFELDNFIGSDPGETPTDWLETLQNSLEKGDLEMLLADLMKQGGR